VPVDKAGHGKVSGDVQGWLLGPEDYGLFEDWSAIVRSRDGYICIRDGLVLEGGI
jgi:hypothetical protein